MTYEFNGLVHDEVDLKLLILYILRRLPAPISKAELFDICICDNGVEYFDFSEYLDSLTESGNIELTAEDCYAITDKGSINASEVENSLPKSVRLAADRVIESASVRLRRYALVKASETADSNGITMHLALSDGDINLLNVDIFCGDESRARIVRRNFRRNAEGYYDCFLKLLTEQV